MHIYRFIETRLYYLMVNIDLCRSGNNRRFSAILVYIICIEEYSRKTSVIGGSAQIDIDHPYDERKSHRYHRHAFSSSMYQREKDKEKDIEFVSFAFFDLFLFHFISFLFLLSCVFRARHWAL